MYVCVLVSSLLPLCLNGKCNFAVVDGIAVIIIFFSLCFCYFFLLSQPLSITTGSTVNKMWYKCTLPNSQSLSFYLSIYPRCQTLRTLTNISNDFDSYFCHGSWNNKRVKVTYARQQQSDSYETLELSKRKSFTSCCRSWSRFWLFSSMLLHSNRHNNITDQMLIHTGKKEKKTRKENRKRGRKEANKVENTHTGLLRQNGRPECVCMLHLIENDRDLVHLLSQSSHKCVFVYYWIGHYCYRSLHCLFFFFWLLRNI